MKNVLIVEDDRNIADLLEIHLLDLECTVTKAFDGAVALKLARATRFDLVILDLMLPGIDGLEVCRQLRAEKDYTPILMLTAKSEELDKVLGLELGADDYLTKPFGVREFIARAKAIFRRIEVLKAEVTSPGGLREIKLGDIIIEHELRKVTIAGKKVELTRKEFDLLWLLASHPGKPFTREQLLTSIWGYQFEGYDHTVNSHINRLRAKVEKDVTKPKYILTAWGVGYRFAEEGELGRSK